MSSELPWKIAADLEAAAQAVKNADWAISHCHESTWSEINKIAGIEHFSSIAAALTALSDKYQAIADAEPELGSDAWLKQSPQFHPGDLA